MLTLYYTAIIEKQFISAFEIVLVNARLVLAVVIIYKIIFPYFTMEADFFSLVEGKIY